MPTPIGVAFVAIGLYCLFRRREWLLGLLIFAGIFQASSALNLGGRGVQPYYFIALMYIVSRSQMGGSSNRSPKFVGRYFLIAFCFVAVLSAIIDPILFAGTPIYSPGISIDEGYLVRPPLAWGIGNLVQAGCLVVNTAVVWLAATDLRHPSTRKFFNLSLGVVVGVILIQFVFEWLGIPFPTRMLANNPSYFITTDVNLSIAGRVAGTYVEPSSAGAGLLLFFGESFYRFFIFNQATLRVLLVALCIGLVRSSSSLVATVAVIALMIVFYPPIRSFHWIKTSRLAKILLILGVGAVITLSPLGAVFASYTTEKNETLSYFFRLASDQYAWQLALHTHGLGVGLGSNRPSSLFTSLLSSVGFLGTALFFCMVIQIARNARQENIWLRWSLLGFLLARLLGGPDINEPQLWTFLALAANCSANTNEMPGLESVDFATPLGPEPRDDEFAAQSTLEER